MRKGKPDCAELQQTGGFGIEDAAGDVDVGDGVAVQKSLSVLEVEQKRNDRDAGGEPGEQAHFGIPVGIYRRDLFLFLHQLRSSEDRQRLRAVSGCDVTLRL